MSTPDEKQVWHVRRYWSYWAPYTEAFLFWFALVNNSLLLLLLLLFMMW
jgi:uncharacterized integral membrane protein